MSEPAIMCDQNAEQLLCLFSSSLFGGVERLMPAAHRADDVPVCNLARALLLHSHLHNRSCCEVGAGATCTMSEHAV